MDAAIPTLDGDMSRYRQKMRTSQRLLCRLAADAGATTIEYGLVAILIAVVAAVAVKLMGEAVYDLLWDAANSF